MFVSFWNFRVNVSCEQGSKGIHGESREIMTKEKASLVSGPQPFKTLWPGDGVMFPQKQPRRGLCGFVILCFLTFGHQADQRVFVDGGRRAEGVG